MAWCPLHTANLRSAQNKPFMSKEANKTLGYESYYLSKLPAWQMSILSFAAMGNPIECLQNWSLAYIPPVI